MFMNPRDWQMSQFLFVSVLAWCRLDARWISPAIDFFDESFGTEPRMGKILK